MVRRSIIAAFVLALPLLSGCCNIHEAAEKGDVRRVRELLDDGAPVYRTNNAGQTALHIAAREGQYEVAKLLLSRRAKVDTRDAFGMTPLDEAARHGYRDMVARFLARGGPVDPELLASALHKAARKGHKDVVALLLDEWPFPDYRGTPLDMLRSAVNLASCEDHKDVAALIIERAATTKEQGALHKFYSDVLLAVAGDGHRDIVQDLIAKGADVNARSDETCSTPLENAALGGQRDVAELLIAKGANVSARDNVGQTPLLSGLSHKKIVALLIARGADVNGRYGEMADGGTLLHLLAQSGEYFPRYKDGAELLIAAGADVNALDGLGKTPLDWAIEIPFGPALEETMSREKARQRQAVVDFFRKHGGRRATPAERHGDRRFDGTWCNTRDKYRFKIEGRGGQILESDSDEFNDGEMVLWFYTFDGNRFTGALKTGLAGWSEIVGELKDDTLHIRADGQTWTMTKPSAPDK
jgi:ankyrin repeat protein